MAKELRVSIITIKKTWELLERNDYIYTVAGKGSYVKKSTKNSLEKKKLKMVKDTIRESIELCRQMDISENELVEIISELYKK